MRSFIFAAIIVGANILAIAPSAAFRPPMKPVDNAGFASADQVAASVGTVSTEVICPSRAFRDADKRGARLTLEKSGAGWREPGVLSTLLLDALNQIWDQCNTAMGSFGNSVGFVEIFAPSAEGAGPVLIVRVQSFLDIIGAWQRVTDIQEEQRQESLRVQAVAAEATRIESARIAQVQRERIAAEERARSAAEWDRFWSNVWLWIKLLFWGAVAVWLFSMREIVMRWYYLLTPHPAQSMVEATMHRGVELDGKAFADIMRPMPGGRIEKEVRAEQARQLAEKAHRYAETMRAEADRIKAEAQQDAEFIRAQDDLAKAAIVHEKAKARLAALRKRVE